MKIANVKLGTLCSVEGILVHSAETIDLVTEVKVALNAALIRLKLPKNGSAGIS